MRSTERLKSELQELKKQVSQDRIARGVPEEPPEDFVSEAMTTVLIEQCKPLFQYIAKYTQICSDSNQILPVNMEIYDRYTDQLKLISYSKSVLQKVFATGISLTKRYMLAADDYSEVSSYVRHLAQALSIAKVGYEMRLDQAAYIHDVSAEMLGVIQTEAKAEYDSLKTDEAFLYAEVQRYIEHYESIKHLF